MRLPGIESGTVDLDLDLDLETTIYYSLSTPPTGFEPARAHAHLFSKQVSLPLGTMMATAFEFHLQGQKLPSLRESNPRRLIVKADWSY